jgi:hypothetical protein
LAIMTTMQERLVFGARRPWFSRLLDNLFEPAKRKGYRLDPRLLPPHLQRDMGLLDPADRWNRPDRPPTGW